MAGWTRYNEHTGEIETGMYDRPFIVRATPKKLGPEATTLAAFRTKTEAEKWVEQNSANYKQGPNGFATLHIENWNEDTMGIAPGICPPGSNIV